MAEPVMKLQPRSALHGLDLPQRVGILSIAEAPPATRLSYRGDASAIGDALGVALPSEPCRSAAAADRAALWLGPDEWLVLAPAEEREALVAAIDRAIAGKAAVVVDISQRNCALTITGPKAELALSTGCPLDLDVAAFPVGMCTRTIFAKAEIVLWRQAREEFRLEIWRSFAPYVVGLLNEAARDLD